jgi:CubicO group peptidase (beta-lactamase class C family)
MAISLSAVAKAQYEDVSDVLRKNVESHNIGGVIALVAVSGHVAFYRSAGELEPGVAMPNDAIVPVSSITKAVTAVAILKLSERRQIDLEDPVEKYVTAFRNVSIRANPDNGAKSVQHVRRAITIRDLLTHQAGILGDGPDIWAIWDKAATAEEFARLLAAVPLQAQPGARFEYGPSYEVLAAIVENVTGQSFESYVTTNVLRPLKMNDSYFFVPAKELNRVPAQYGKNDKGELIIATAAHHENPHSRFSSGGGGLRSTVWDYYRFARFLLNGGELDGVRLLKADTVRQMTSNQVGDHYPEAEFGWGYGVSVRIAPPADGVDSLGSYGWQGGTGTLFLADPCARLIAVIFAPTRPATVGVQDLFHDFLVAAYQDSRGMIPGRCRDSAASGSGP